MNYNENQAQRSENRDAPRRRPQDKNPIDRLMSSMMFAVTLPIILIYLELIVHLSAFSGMSTRFFAYITLFCVSLGMVIALVCTLFNKTVNYVISLVIIGVLTLLSAIHVVYSAFFGTFFEFANLGMAGNIADYMDNTFRAIFANLHWILLLFVPFILFAIFGRKLIVPEKMGWMPRVCCAVFAVCFFMLGTLYVNTDEEDFGDKFAYGEGFLVNDAIGRFGVFTTARLELQYMMFGNEADEPEDTIVINNDTTAPRGEDIFGTKAPVTSDTPVTNPPDGPETTVGGDESGEVTTGENGETTVPDPPKPPVVIDRSPQRMDIDFASLKSKALSAGNKKVYNLLTFLESRAGTNKNEYTGMFEGKNLIFITVEAWAPSAINEKLTPTLYKMKNEGFVFDNYYCSCWGGSTATGEYANITGNFYYKATCIEKSASTYQPFTLGNMFRAEGYATDAFHNHTYKYYSRNLSHPNFGYDWHAIGNWDVEFTPGWPTSDHELALNSLSYITADKPFHIYYMTTSGHANQTFVGNAQAAKHRNYVTSVIGGDYKNQLSVSYIACEYEVELMVKELYDRCAELGILEDTVFVLAPDHFPYSLSPDDANNQAALAEMYGLPASNIYYNYELYKAPLVIWSGSMKNPIKIDKVCSAIDILPTVLNLFGLEYDSRLITGQDILDLNVEGIAPINFVNEQYHFVTDYGFFNIKTKKFTLFEGYSISDPNMLNSYLDPKRDYMYYWRTYSPDILNTDLYRFIFK